MLFHLYHWAQNGSLQSLLLVSIGNRLHNGDCWVPALVSPPGAYVCKGRWLMPLGEALWENADLQLCIPMKFKRAPPLPPPPGPAVCSLLLDMLASNPDARPPADQLQARVRSALKEDSH